MIPRDGPPRLGSAEGPKGVCSAANPSSIAPNPTSSQAEIVAFPRRAARPRGKRRITVQISAADSRGPLGRTRALNLTERDLAWLVEAAERLEASA
jgi:hypothetical protein